MECDRKPCCQNKHSDFLFGENHEPAVFPRFFRWGLRPFGIAFVHINKAYSDPLSRT